MRAIVRCVDAVLRLFGFTVLTRTQHHPPPERVIGYSIGRRVHRYTATAAELGFSNLPPDRVLAYGVDVGADKVTFRHTDFKRERHPTVKPKGLPAEIGPCPACGCQEGDLHADICGVRSRKLNDGMDEDTARAAWAEANPAPALRDTPIRGHNRLDWTKHPPGQEPA